MTDAQNGGRELLRALNHARSCLRDAKDEATNGITANPRFIDQRVTLAREAIDRALLLVKREEA